MTELLYFIYDSVFEILIIIIGLYLAFFKNYFSEKGKQLALKEDIESITTKIESIKAELDLAKGKKLNISSLERESILKFWESYSKWRNKIIYETSPLLINEKNFMNYQHLKDALRQCQVEFQLNVDRLSLFINEKEFYLLKSNVSNKTLELQQNQEEMLDKTSDIFKKTQDPIDTNVLNSKLLVLLDNHYKKQENLFKSHVSLERKLSSFLQAKLLEIET